MKEIYKEIKGYPDYQVSNFGNVKSIKYSKERILNASNNGNGYQRVTLCYSNKKKNFHIHSIVAQAFLGYVLDGTREMVVDHIDNNKANNHISNLRVVTHRFNSSRKIGGTSKYTGVSFNKQSKKWVAYININNKAKYLGLFKNEYDAHLKYQEELKKAL